MTLVFKKFPKSPGVISELAFWQKLSKDAEGNVIKSNCN